MAKIVDLVAAGTVATAGASGNGVASDQFHTVTVQINVTAASGTTPSMTVYIDVSNDGTTWTQAAAGTAITAAGSQLISVGPGMATNTNGIGAQVRARYAITGTTPSFTFGVKAVFK